jgi:hypothetical protein
MKTIQISVILIFLCFSSVSLSGAALSESYVYGPGPAAFMVIDENGTTGDGFVTLSFFSTTVGLQYQYGTGVWEDVILSQIISGQYIGSLTIDTGNDHNEMVRFRIPTATEATMIFSGPNGPFWHTVILQWNGNGTSSLSVATASGSDNVAPVPIPGAAWLFAPALAGLVGLRRRFNKHST